MDLMDLPTDEKGLGTFKITNSPSDTWIETIVCVGDRRIKSYVNKPLPLIGAITTVNF